MMQASSLTHILEINLDQLKISLSLEEKEMAVQPHDS